MASRTTIAPKISHASRLGIISRTLMAACLIDQHGQRNPAAKLSDNEVARIRLAYAQGGYTQQQLAERFGVAHQTVSKLVRGHRRTKQGGPVHDADHRHVSAERDPKTGQFTSIKKSSGRLLDGREHNEFPKGCMK